MLFAPGVGLACVISKKRRSNLGVPYSDYMKKKFGTDGPSDRFKAMRDALEAAGPSVGIDFKFNDIPMRPNTLDAHRLIKWAQGQELGDAASEALFQAFFTASKDIGDPAILSAIAEEIGIDSELIAELLSKEDDKNAVREEIMFSPRNLLGYSHDHISNRRFLYCVASYPSACPYVPCWADQN